MDNRPNKRFLEKRIGVLMGGLSSEREVSLKSGAAISASLARLGYHQIPIDMDADIALTLKREHLDVVFIALHGRYGEDGAIQGLLEIMNIPYTGSKLTASALAMNKIASDGLLKAHGLPLPKTLILTQEETKKIETLQLSIPLPFVIKPVSEGSSVGVSIVKSPEQIKPALETAFRFGTKILLQSYISGMEVHVGILDEKPLGAIEIKSKGTFYDYDAKYVPGMSKHIFPAPLPADVYQHVLDLALQAHQALGCKSYSRVDLLIDSEMKPYVLEVNTLPGMTETSLMPEMARECGIDFDALVEKILNTACTEHEDKSCPSR
ncbi:MAG: D-alanine--D-alanine ligase [Nitrospirae bacterium]|nr:D-alanine--D-alanine ligase [Candidatus Manganitrophaceae bacterium]